MSIVHDARARKERRLGEGLTHEVRDGPHSLDREVSMMGSRGSRGILPVEDKRGGYDHSWAGDNAWWRCTSG